MMKTKSLVVLVASTLLAPSAALSQASLQADYSVELRGIPVGTAKLRIETDGDRYSVKASGRAGGVAAIVSDAKASGEASGQISGNRLVPAEFDQRWTEDGEEEVLGLRFRDRQVSSVSISPEPKAKRKTVPVSAEHKRNVLDPLTALVFPGSVADGATLCDRTLPVFDGRQRFDLTLSFSRKESAGRGAAGRPAGAVVCSIRYRPVAGHRPGRSSIRFMEDNKDMEVWLAPIADSGLVAPARIRVRTRAGVLKLEAQRFSATTSASPQNAAVN